MITLLQIPWSPFCITARSILERNGIPFRVRNLPPYGDRAPIIRATKGRGATVPCLLDGKQTIVDETEFGQEVARHLDRKFRLGLFPADKEGMQLLLSRYIENDLEAVGFKVNDSYVIPRLPLTERVAAIRWKERKFGRGCVKQWTVQRRQLNSQFAELLAPFDNMLAHSCFLLADRPLFADYNLFGVIGNHLYSGKTKLPPLKRLRRWHDEMSR